MKNKHFAPVIAISALVTAFSAEAHDPKEHMKNAEKPDCKAMEGMDHSRMDMDDPVMQAIMQKCMQEIHGDNAKQQQPSDAEDQGRASEQQN